MKINRERERETDWMYIVQASAGFMKLKRDIGKCGARKTRTVYVQGHGLPRSASQMSSRIVVVNGTRRANPPSSQQLAFALPQKPQEIIKQHRQGLGPV